MKKETKRKKEVENYEKLYKNLDKKNRLEVLELSRQQEIINSNEERMKELLDEAEKTRITLSLAPLILAILSVFFSFLLSITCASNEGIHTALNCIIIFPFIITIFLIIDKINFATRFEVTVMVILLLCSLAFFLIIGVNCNLFIPTAILLRILLFIIYGGIFFVSYEKNKKKFRLLTGIPLAIIISSIIVMATVIYSTQEIPSWVEKDEKIAKQLLAEAYTETLEITLPQEFNENNLYLKETLTVSMVNPEDPNNLYKTSWDSKSVKCTKGSRKWYMLELGYDQKIKEIKLVFTHFGKVHEIILPIVPKKPLEDLL